MVAESTERVCYAAHLLSRPLRQLQLLLRMPAEVPADRYLYERTFEGVARAGIDSLPGLPMYDPAGMKEMKQAALGSKSQEPKEHITPAAVHRNRLWKHLC